jgi:hypothetical protein
MYKRVDQPDEHEEIAEKSRKHVENDENGEKSSDPAAFSVSFNSSPSCC